MGKKKPLLHRLGESLWGKQWQTAAAKCAGCTVRSMLRYSGGDRDTPPKVIDKLRLEAQARRGLLGDLMEEAARETMK